VALIAEPLACQPATRWQPARMHGTRGALPYRHTRDSSQRRTASTKFPGASVILGGSWSDFPQQKFLRNSTHHALCFTDQEVAEDKFVSPV
jgi:hypothetical protein